MVKIFQTPKKNAKASEWFRFIETAPREIVAEVYNRLSKNKVSYVVETMRCRLLSLESPFVITRNAYYTVVLPYSTNQQIKDKIQEMGKNFPLLIIEGNGFSGNSGKFRGYAISKDLILAGSLSEISVDFEEASMFAKNYGMHLLKAEDIVYLNKNNISVGNLFARHGYQVRVGRYWLADEVGDERLVYNLGTTNPAEAKFCCMAPTEKAYVLMKL